MHILLKQRPRNSMIMKDILSQKFSLETDVLIFVKKIGNCVERNETKLETFVIQKLQKFLLRVKRSHKIISRERKKEIVSHAQFQFF